MTQAVEGGADISRHQYRLWAVNSLCEWVMVGLRGGKGIEIDRGWLMEWLIWILLLGRLVPQTRRHTHTEIHQADATCVRVGWEGGQVGGERRYKPAVAAGTVPSGKNAP